MCSQLNILPLGSMMHSGRALVLSERPTKQFIDNEAVFENSRCCTPLLCCRPSSSHYKYTINVTGCQKGGEETHKVSHNVQKFFCELLLSESNIELNNHSSLFVSCSIVSESRKKILDLYPHP